MIAIASTNEHRGQELARCLSPAKIDVVDELVLASDVRKACGLDYDRIVLVRSGDEKPGKRERDLARQVKRSGADVLEVSEADLDARPAEISSLVRLFCG